MKSDNVPSIVGVLLFFLVVVIFLGGIAATVYHDIRRDHHPEEWTGHFAPIIGRVDVADDGTYTAELSEIAGGKEVKMGFTDSRNAQRWLYQRAFPRLAKGPPPPK